MIYFVQPDIGGPIKIGFTAADDVYPRIDELQAACPWPLLLLLAVPGDVKRERALHHQFRHLRVRNEWFAPGDSLIDWLQAEGSAAPKTTCDRPRDAQVAMARKRLLPSDLHRRIVKVMNSPRAWRSPREIGGHLGGEVDLRHLVRVLATLERHGYVEQCRFPSGLCEWRAKSLVSGPAR